MISVVLEFTTLAREEYFYIINTHFLKNNTNAGNYLSHQIRYFRINEACANLSGGNEYFVLLHCDLLFINGVQEKKQENSIKFTFNWRLFVKNATQFVQSIVIDVDINLADIIFFLRTNELRKCERWYSVFYVLNVNN